MDDEKDDDECARRKKRRGGKRASGPSARGRIDAAYGTVAAGGRRTLAVKQHRSPDQAASTSAGVHWPIGVVCGARAAGDRAASRY
ncbi:uncharacterized protein BDCG_03457 [Blastomyces dermatitidis ER-3]|uniref:Uncharacterized protein n=1 Tax=Ajellomyces dermatitidis (strain ER-3 / ATCC MYA-2586) TaxID=559297 RepID=A0ABP2EWB5_AJEDR|nr:uncharacterized protein BDCG_03457 [Blastomyces dermatitidis ER-3]EEQ88337.2 hypothetical protein BDCG_03457 [Blastomyces dermatitidis ER-3]